MMNGDRLQGIRRRLEAIEMPLAVALKARSHYSTAPNLYDPKGIHTPDFKGSFLEFSLRKHVPNFFSHPLIHLVNGDGEAEELSFKPVKINRNPEIMDHYSALMALICPVGYHIGENTPIAQVDAICLALLSRRVHLGVAVAEAKLMEDKGKFLESMSARNGDRLNVLLRDLDVEDLVAKRFGKKAAERGLNRDIATDFFRDYVIPATVGVQVEYLLNRPLD